MKKVLFIVYDNGSKNNEFPLATAYLSSVLRNAGYVVTIYNSDIYHYSDQHLTDYLDKNQFDFVMLSFIGGYWQYKQFVRISSSVNKSINRKNFYYIIGGHGPSPDPEFFLRKGNVDFICIGEGERTILELCSVLENHNPHKLPEINGIAYLKENKLITTKQRDLIQDLDSIPFPSWDLFPIEHYASLSYPNSRKTDRTMSVLSTRGCIFKCTFCYRIFDNIRYRSPKNVVDEIQHLKDKYRISYIIFADELFMGVPKRTVEMCNAFINANLDIHFSCDGRLNFAKPELLSLMKKAGCVYITYGIESFDNTVLKNMNKNLTTDVIDKGLSETVKAGITPGVNVIFGNIGDNLKILKKGVNLILKYTDLSEMRTIRPVTPYPGCDLFYRAIREGKIKDVEDFYENKHKNSDLLSVNFTTLTDEQFNKALYDSNSTLINTYFEKQKKSYDTVMKKIYFDGDSSFRGFRQT